MDWILIPLFAATAFTYALVGFGGGSTYTALLAAWGVPYTQIPQLSLLCNILVVAGGGIHFFREGYGNVRRILPFLLTSIPMAFVGGRLPISKEVFLLLLGISLFAAGMRLLLLHQPRLQKARALSHAWRWGLVIGAALGLLSGLVGIGGGIFLAPILYFMRWDSPKGIAFASSFFILMNSVSGLAGQLFKSGLLLDAHYAAPLLLAVLVGGQLGSIFALRRFTAFRVQQVTGMVIVLIGARILWRAAGI